MRIKSQSGDGQLQYLKVAALTPGWAVPSARFRVRQYRYALAEHGISLREYCPFVNQMIQLPGILGRVRRRYIFPWLFVQTLMNIIARIPAFFAARQADVTLINRSIIPGLEECVALLPKPRVLDVDDAIWLTDPRGAASAARLAQRVDAVIVGNEHLAKWYRNHNGRVYVVPTAVDTRRYLPRQLSRHTEGSMCTIGWMGTDGNFPHLDLVKSAIEAVLNDRSNTRMLIVSNLRPSGWKFDNDRLVFRAWSAATELRDLQDMDIGLMPLRDDEWARGKCSFKMLQYLAVGIPVVVSPVGMNADVLNGADVGFGAYSESDWVSSLHNLIDDEALRRWKGGNGRQLVERKYSTEFVAARLAATLREIDIGKTC